MEIVIQGLLYPHETPIIVENFLKTSFVDRVIVSCWETCPQISFPSEVKVIRTPNEPNSGVGNRNLQIKSSSVGLREVTSKYSAKFRSDQIFPVASLELMNRFFQKYKDSKLKYEDGTGPECKIFVSGDFFPYPFHPRDHVFWSDTQSLINLFDIPFDNNPKELLNQYHRVTRTEAYIASFYYARFDSRIKKMLENPQEYLVDNAPKVSEALEIANGLRDEIFKVFPRVELVWPKYNMYIYRYGIQSFVERWHDEAWE